MVHIPESVDLVAAPCNDAVCKFGFTYIEMWTLEMGLWATCPSPRTEYISLAQLESQRPQKAPKLYTVIITPPWKELTFHPELFNICLDGGYSQSYSQCSKDQQPHKKYFATVTLDPATQCKQQGLELGPQPQWGFLAHSLTLGKETEELAKGTVATGNSNILAQGSWHGQTSSLQGKHSSKTLMWGHLLVCFPRSSHMLETCGGHPCPSYSAEMN